MSRTIPSVWCADLLVPVDPCSAGAEVTREGESYPLKNELWDAATGAVSLAAAANEVVTFQLVVEGRPDRIESVRFANLKPVEAEVYQHVAVPIEGRWYDDALVPVDLRDAGASVRDTTARALRVPGRKRQTFTVELFVPKGVKAGEREIDIRIRLKGGEERVRVRLTVHAFELGDRPACTADINNYSRSFGQGFEGANDDMDLYLRLERAYFREARKHRAVVHVLSYSQSGHQEPGFAPVLDGRGRHRHVADWRPFDRHWGAYLDGSAYRGMRGAPDWPAEYLYTPVNCNWPAYFENFGKAGFEVEFRNVLGAMAAHFHQKKWGKTKFEVFFNHKARWKYYPWDMDEIRFDRDNDATLYFGRLTNDVAKPYPKVRMINRIDSSWIFDKSAQSEMADVIQLWVVNRGCHSHAPDEVERLRRKGQEVWFYGGAGSFQAANRLDNLHWPWIAWGRQTDGFCWWNGVGWGSWEQPGGGGNYCFYPGARFGIEGPLASIRLKVLHRGMQDHAYLTLLTEKTGSRRAADRVIAKTIGSRGREDWYQRREGREVSGADIQTSSATAKAWNQAPIQAWTAARAELAKAIEGA
jgi:hypothetical protein